VEKSAEILQNLRNIFDIGKNSKALVLSPSGINRYLDCPMKFYYYYVAKLKINQEVENTIQAVDFGNIFHRSAELFYEHIVKDNGANIEKSHLEPYIKKDALLYPFVDKAFKECFFKIEGDEKPEYDGQQFINREVVHRFLLRLVKMDAEHAPFRYIGSEQDASFCMETQTADGDKVSLSIGGRVDRMDDKEGTIEIVDYKTGGKPDAPKDVDALFASTGKRSGYIFQAMLYSAAVSMAEKGKKVSPSLLYIHKQSQARRDNFVINIDKQPVMDFSLHRDKFMERLQKTLDEIFDVNTPFRCTDDKDRCTYCDYNVLCGER
jgi:ATP-dependent helicase/DNAse subunit B